VFLEILIPAKIRFFRIMHSYPGILEYWVIQCSIAPYSILQKGSKFKVQS
jgi:hypothetical protein